MEDDDMSEHGRRFEDLGIGRIIKFWPALIAIFTAGAWYESAKSNAQLISQEQQELRRMQDGMYGQDKRLTQVEDAVIALREILQLERRTRR